MKELAFVYEPGFCLLMCPVSRRGTMQKEALEPTTTYMEETVIVVNVNELL